MTKLNIEEMNSRALLNKIIYYTDLMDKVDKSDYGVEGSDPTIDLNMENLLRGYLSEVKRRFPGL